MGVPVEVGVSIGVGVSVEVGDSTEVGVVVDVAVAVLTVPVGVAVLVAVAVASPRMISTNCSSPKNIPVRVDMAQFPRTAPVLFAGAVMAMESSISEPGLTALSKTRVGPPMASPPVKANMKPTSQVQMPLFLTSQVLVKV